MKKVLKHIFRALAFTLLAILALIVLTVAALYIPPVQDFAVEKVLTALNSSGDMHLQVHRFRLRFPLRIDIDSVAMTSPGMEIQADKAAARVAVLPLLKGVASVEELALNGATVNIGTSDSTLYMRSTLAEASLTDATIGLMSKKINVGLLAASRGKVNIVITPDTVPPPVKESAPVEWVINLRKARLQNVDYSMEMLPTIAALECHLPLAQLKEGEINLARSTIDVHTLSLDSVSASYLVPTPEYVASHPLPDTSPAEADSATSAPWTIRARHLRLNNARGLYATEGIKPAAPNFDPSYIQAEEINLAVDSFYNRGTTIDVPISRFSARERCGVALNLHGMFSMDSSAMHARDFELTTPTSTITLNAMMGLDTVNPPLNVVLSASLSPDDIRRLAPAAASPIADALPPYSPLLLSAGIGGTMDALEISGISAEIPRHISLSAKGSVSNYSDINRALGNITISGDIRNGEFLKPALLDAKMSRTVNIPPLRVTGNASLNRGVIGGHLRAVTGNGDVALDARWNNRILGYDLNLDMNSFPVQSILPTMGLRDIDATADVSGHGLDIFSPKTEVKADITLKHAVYQGHPYSDITLKADISGGNASVKALSANPAADFSLDAAGNLAGDTFNWTFNGDVRRIDLRALALSDSIAEGSLSLAGKASLTPGRPATRRSPGKPMNVKADLQIPSLTWVMPNQTLRASDITLDFNAADSSTTAALTNRDLRLNFASGMPLDSVMARFTLASSHLAADITRRRISVDTLQRSLPPFRLDLYAGADNLIQNFLNGQKKSFSTLSMNMSNDTVIAGAASLIGLKMGDTRIDSLALAFHQRGDYLLYNINMNNLPGTFDHFAHVDAKGYLNQDRIALLFKQQNIKEETGYSIGLTAAVDSADNLTVHFVPFHPVIGYKDWEINKDNFISFNLLSHHFDADLNLFNDRSSLRLFTRHNPSDTVAGQEDLVLQLKDLFLQDWLAINPFMPAITGSLSADMNLSYNKPDINGSGTVNLADLTYGKQKVGNFDLDLSVSTNPAGTVRASTTLMVNGQKAMTAVGNLNDSTAANPFLLDFKMIHFPLYVLNPFLPKGTATLHGDLNGEMDVTGSLTEPLFNGFLDFDTTRVSLAMLGTDFTFSEEKIPVTDNLVSFNNFTIHAVNSNPLTINGTVDMRSISSPQLNLALSARNMQIVGSQKTRKSQAYGKAFIDLDAAVKGSLSLLDINASLNLLPGTNVTYVMPDAVSQLTSRSNQDMVKFVNFNDTAQVASADTIAPPSMLMNIDARLEISTGTTVSVELSTDGKDKVQIQSAGILNYTQDYMNDQRASGRLNLNGGFIRYSIPVMGEKMFTFREGSYIVFNGDMLNPQLNVLAYDRVRANVSQSGGNNRVVNFDVDLSVTGSLDEMNVVFDLQCPDDITITNELKSMTPEQRANQAMNLLLYGSYRGGGTQTITSGNAGTNALFSFVESQLNSWASSAIKGVDLSFGINQYDKTVDGANTTAMNYSYQVSKSLFDDRFKIVVGGNYTTDASADENFAQNLIADISFEYFLNKAGTMYVRLFRHTGYESILEGEITQTGVGFVYKKKIGRIADIFKFLRPRRRKPEAAPAPEPAGNRPVPRSEKSSSDAAVATEPEKKSAE